MTATIRVQNDNSLVSLTGRSPELNKLSGEKAAYMLDRTLHQPQRRPAEFARYERHLGRVLDLYLKFVKARYTQEFAEVFFNPTEHLQLVQAVNSVLAGSERQLPEVKCRLRVFELLVFLQKHFAIIAPRMSFQPEQPATH